MSSGDIGMLLFPVYLTLAGSEFRKVGVIQLITNLWSAGQCEDEVLCHRVNVHYIDGGVVDQNTMAFLTEHLFRHQHRFLVIDKLKTYNVSISSHHTNT